MFGDLRCASAADQLKHRRLNAMAIVASICGTGFIVSSARLCALIEQIESDIKGCRSDEIYLAPPVAGSNRIRALMLKRQHYKLKWLSYVTKAKQSNARVRQRFVESY